MSVSKRQAKPLRTVSLLTVVIVVGLAAITTLWKKDAIEVDLLQRTRQALDQYGFMSIQVQFEGRDGTLAIPEPEQAAITPHLSALAHLKGVRKLDTELLNPQELAVATTSLLPLVPEISNLFVQSREHPLEQLDLSKVYFQYAQSTLTRDNLKVLNQLVLELKRYPDSKVEIAAHTDNTGTALGNLAMSTARAQQVVHYLVSQGVNATQLIAVGYGSTRPINTNTTAQGRASNQRIAVTVLKE